MPARATTGKEYALPQTPRALQVDAMPTQKQTNEPDSSMYEMRKALRKSQGGRLEGNTASNTSSQLFDTDFAGLADVRDQAFEQNTTTKGSDQTFGSSWNPGQGPNPFDWEHSAVKKSPGNNDQVSTKEQKPELPGKEEKAAHPWVSRLINKIRGPQTKGSASSVSPLPSAQLGSLSDWGVTLRRKGQVGGKQAPQQAGPIFGIDGR